MSKRVIATKDAPAAIGPYSQAIVSEGCTINVSGQIPIDPKTGAFPSDDVREQTRQCLTNLRNILEAAGAHMTDVVETTVMLADIADFADMNETYAEFFDEPYPARAAFQVAGLPRNARVEIKAVARLSK